MPRAHHVLTNFTAGELSGRLFGRADLAKYHNGARRLENMIVQPHGGAARRPGTRFLAEVKDSSKATRLIPFQFSTTQTYVLEFGHQYVRFYRDGDQLMDDGSLKSSGGSATPLELVSPYGSTDLADLKFTQSADTLFLCHPDYAPRELRRASDVSWSFVAFDFQDGPYLTEEQSNPGGSIELEPSATTGSGVTLTATGGSPFASTDVGRLVRLKVGDRAIAAFEEHGEGSHTRVMSENHDLRTGNEITITGTANYDGTYTVTYYTPNRFTIAKAFAGDDGVDVDEVQTVTIDATGGTFKLTHNGNQTAALDWDCTAGELETALEALASLTAVTVTGGPGATAPLVVTFTGADGGIDQGILLVTDNSLTGGASTVDVVETVAGHDGSSGRFTRTDLPNQRLWGYAKITGYSSPTVVTVTVLEAFNAALPTADWRFGVWSDTTGWPWVPIFSGQRLFFGGCDAYPQSVWGSMVADFELFSPSDFDGVVAADHGLVVTLADDRVNAVYWMAGSDKGLVIGTDGAEFVVRQRSTADPLGPDNVEARRQSTYGSRRRVRPAAVGNTVLFTQAAGRKVRELAYQFEADQFVAQDLTLLSEHITRGLVADTSYQQEPSALVWAIDSSGGLLSLTYEPEQKVAGWAEHPIGGAFAGGAAQVASIATIRDDAGSDQLWLIVKRTVDGGTVQYVELLTDQFDAAAIDQADAFFVDSGITYDDTATVTIDGLDHLEGQTVKILADGATHEDKTVSGGEVTLDRLASTVQVGLAYESIIQTMPLVVPTSFGDSRGRLVRITDATIWFHESLGAKFGYDLDNLETVVFRDPDDPMDAPPALLSGQEELNFPSGDEKDAFIYITQTDPLPLTVLAIGFELRISDR